MFTVTMTKESIKKEKTKTMIICGHGRSGTTLLNRICNSHKDITMTFEFRSFSNLNNNYSEYTQTLRKDWYERRLVINSYRNRKWLNRISSCMFYYRYITGVWLHRNRQIDLPVIKKILTIIFPRSYIVGDKFPKYIFQLDDLIKVKGLHCIVIYRDCRDVVRSKIEQKKAKGKVPIDRKDDVEASGHAHRWVESIDIMDRNKEHIHTIRYEELIQNTESVINKLGDWLGVDPAGFNSKIITSSSIGKYKKGLSDSELAAVLEIARPTMQRLGYQI